ncbi:MAG: Type 1 glutamine amidotransferase-like domain-containing protein [Oscillospiraceae bacterium]|nr:Type 1 glutamine amidotransferase-like domain-containing protein [Oscillospiraceae bacterium]
MALDNRKVENGYKNVVENASCVFMLGGYVQAQQDFLKEHGLIESLKNHNGVIIGMSAGAINMGSYSVIANLKHPPASTLEGIGLVDITVIPHFNRVDIPYLTKEVFPLTNRSFIYGICDDAAIIIQDNLTKYFGTIYKITPNNIQLLTETDLI